MADRDIAEIAAGIRQASPQPVVGCYTMDVYCDRQGCNNMGQAAEPTKAGCKRALREVGWVFHHDRTTTCSTHLQQQEQSK